MNFIGRYETLDDEVEKLEDQLKIKIELPHLNKSEPRAHKDPKEYFTSSKLIDLVVTNYREDFEYFGYSTNI